MVVIAEAAGLASQISSTLSTSFTSIASDLGSTLTTILPVALGILGGTMALKFGIKWFKQITGK